MSIANEKWDYLIVLDACRYDYFEQVYADYVQGDLEKRVSPGSCTNEWRNSHFPDKYDDIVYVSSNPHFSDKTSVYDYTAGDHFHKVYDVWRHKWTRGTVLPEDLTEAAIEAASKHPDKRLIAHYMQPHAPYLILDEDAKGYASPEGGAGRQLEGEIDFEQAAKHKKKMLKWLLKLFSWNKILGNHPEWILRKWLGLPPRAPMEYVVHNFDDRVLRNAYRANLKLVLKSVAGLLEYLSGRIIITSDHGDFLGENKCYSHPPKTTHPILNEVPWLVIDKESPAIKSDQQAQANQYESSSPATMDEDEQIQQRLRDIGYL